MRSSEERQAAPLVDEDEEEALLISAEMDSDERSAPLSPVVTRIKEPNYSMPLDRGNKVFDELNPVVIGHGLRGKQLYDALIMHHHMHRLMRDAYNSDRRVLSWFRRQFLFALDLHTEFYPWIILLLVIDVLFGKAIFAKVAEWILRRNASTNSIYSLAPSLAVAAALSGLLIQKGVKEIYLNWRGPRESEFPRYYLAWLRKNPQSINPKALYNPETSKDCRHFHEFHSGFAAYLLDEGHYFASKNFINDIWNRFPYQPTHQKFRIPLELPEEYVQGDENILGFESFDESESEVEAEEPRVMSKFEEKIRAEMRSQGRDPDKLGVNKLPTRPSSSEPVRKKKKKEMPQRLFTLPIESEPLFDEETHVDPYSLPLLSGGEVFVNGWKIQLEGYLNAYQVNVQNARLHGVAQLNMTAPPISTDYRAIDLTEFMGDYLKKLRDYWASNTITGNSLELWARHKLYFSPRVLLLKEMLKRDPVKRRAQRGRSSQALSNPSLGSVQHAPDDTGLISEKNDERTPLVQRPYVAYQQNAVVIENLGPVESEAEESKKLRIFWANKAARANQAFKLLCILRPATKLNESLKYASWEFFSHSDPTLFEDFCQLSWQEKTHLIDDLLQGYDHSILLALSLIQDPHIEAKMLRSLLRNYMRDLRKELPALIMGQNIYILTLAKTGEYRQHMQDIFNDVPLACQILEVLCASGEGLHAEHAQDLFFNSCSSAEKRNAIFKALQKAGHHGCINKLLLRSSANGEHFEDVRTLFDSKDENTRKEAFVHLARMISRNDGHQQAEVFARQVAKKNEFDRFNKKNFHLLFAGIEGGLNETGLNPPRRQTAVARISFALLKVVSEWKYLNKLAKKRKAATLRRLFLAFGFPKHEGLDDYIQGLYVIGSQLRADSWERNEWHFREIFKFCLYGAEKNPALQANFLFAQLQAKYLEIQAIQDREMQKQARQILYSLVHALVNFDLTRNPPEKDFLSALAFDPLSQPKKISAVFFGDIFHAICNANIKPEKIYIYLHRLMDAYYQEPMHERLRIPNRIYDSFRLMGREPHLSLFELWLRVAKIRLDEHRRDLVTQIINELLAHYWDANSPKLVDFLLPIFCRMGTDICEEGLLPKLLISLFSPVEKFNYKNLVRAFFLGLYRRVENMPPDQFLSERAEETEINAMLRYGVMIVYSFYDDLFWDVKRMRTIQKDSETIKTHAKIMMDVFQGLAVKMGLAPIELINSCKEEGGLLKMTFQEMGLSDWDARNIYKFMRRTLELQLRSRVAFFNIEPAAETIDLSDFDTDEPTEDLGCEEGTTKLTSQHFSSLRDIIRSDDEKGEAGTPSGDETIHPDIQDLNPDASESVMDWGSASPGP